MSTWSSRASSVSASTGDVAELDKTFRADSLCASMRGRTSGTEDVARVLQSECEHWSQKCLQQVGGEVEKAMQKQAEALESRAVEKAKESLRPFISEVASELHGRISRSLHQELEVQRVEWEATACQERKDRQTQAEAALLAAKEEVEARYSARLDAMQATIGELCGELQEQRQKIAMLSGRLERLGQHHPERVRTVPSVDLRRCSADISGDRVCTKSTEGTPRPPQSTSLAPRSEIQELAPAIVRKLPPVAGPPAAPLSGASAGTEMPRLLGRGRAPSRHLAASREASVGPADRARPEGTEEGGSAMPNDLKESLRHVVSAVQRTLGGFEEDPQQGAPAPDEQDPVSSCRFLAPAARAAAALHRAPTQQPRGAQAALVPPLSLVAVHQARQVLVQTPRTARSVALRPAVALQHP